MTRKECRSRDAKIVRLFNEGMRRQDIAKEMGTTYDVVKIAINRKYGAHHKPICKQVVPKPSRKPRNSTRKVGLIRRFFRWLW